MFWLNINHHWFVPRPSHHQYASLKWSKTGWCGKAWKKANHHYHTSNSCCKVQESAGKLCMQVPTVYKNSVFCTTSIVQERLFKWGWASPTLAWLHCTRVCVCVNACWLVVWTDHLAYMLEGLGMRPSVYTYKLEHVHSPLLPCLIPRHLSWERGYLLPLPVWNPALHTWYWYKRSHSPSYPSLIQGMYLGNEANHAPTCLHYILVARLIFCSGEERRGEERRGAPHKEGGRLTKLYKQEFVVPVVVARQ